MVNQEIQELNVASQEQAKAIVQITRGVEQISSVVQTNSATSEGSAAASEELSAQAATMNQIINKYRLASDNNDI